MLSIPISRREREGQSGDQNIDGLDRSNLGRKEYQNVGERKGKRCDETKVQNNHTPYVRLIHSTRNQFRLCSSNPGSMLAFCNAITSAALGSDLGPTGQANGSGGGQEAKTGEEMGLTDPKTPRRETVPKRRLEGLERNGRDGAASPETYHGYPLYIVIFEPT